MTTVLALQRALIARTYDIGGADGLIGPKTLGAAVAAVNASLKTAAVPRCRIRSASSNAGNGTSLACRSIQR